MVAAAAHRPITVLDTDYGVADDVILGHGEQLLLLFPSLSDVVIPFTYRINEICDFCGKHGIDVVGLTSGGKDEIAEWNDLSMADYRRCDCQAKIQGVLAIIIVSKQ